MDIIQNGLPYERYLRNASNYLFTPTYDNSNQANHPKVLYFEDGWNGFKYWMAFTPYPHSNDDYENPSIIVSQDGLNWNVPSGSTNPVISLSNDIKLGAHYSDPHLVMRDQVMELWYRYNPAKPGEIRPDNSISIIYRIKSKDGIVWTQPEIIIKGSNYYSPVIIYEESKYKIWYTTDTGMYYIQSDNDCASFTNPQTVFTGLPGDRIPWHFDIIHSEKGYEMLVSNYSGKVFGPNFQHQLISYSVSNDKINFANSIDIIKASIGNSWDNQQIYRPSLIRTNNEYHIYYSAMSQNSEWHIGLISGTDL